MRLWRNRLMYRLGQAIGYGVIAAALATLIVGFIGPPLTLIWLLYAR